MSRLLFRPTIAGPLLFPPKPQTSVKNLSLVRPSGSSKPNPNLIPNATISRRDVGFLSLLSLLLSLPEPASAFSIGISGPKEWLKEQKKKSSKFLLAPIYASRESLQAAYLILTRDSDNTSTDIAEVQKLFKSAARDCIPQERNSFVSFQAKTGVEVCTFTLIVKNASSLLDDKDPVKLEAEAMLSDLIGSFTFLNNLANESDLGGKPNRQKVADALTGTISSLDKFEQGVKDCLEA